MKKLISFAAATAVAIAVSTAADAAPVKVTVDGHDWNVSTIFGSFNDIENDLSTPSLMDQPWWGSDSLAGNFADAVGESLGLPNSIAGPIFAYEPGVGVVCQSFSPNPANCGAATGRAFSVFIGSVQQTFAVASKVSPVPLPAGGALLLTALAAVGIARRRKAAGKA